MKLASEFGQYASAVSTLGAMGVASPSAEVVETLRVKHPEGKLPVDPRLDKHISDSIISASKEEVMYALWSFPKGTACSRSGLRVERILQLVGSGIGVESPDSVISLFTRVVNLLLHGNVPTTLCPLIASGNLVPLLKKDGSIRPIAVGEILRRIASKIVLRRIGREVS